MSQNETVKRKSNAGRKSKLTEKKMEIAKEAILNDANNQELAKILGITVSTLTNWRSNSEEFLAIYEQAKLDKNKMVEASLYSKALGYKYIQKEKYTDKNGDITLTEKEVFVPPDFQSQQFWLKNKDSEQWKDKTDQHITGNLTQNVKTETPEEQLERLKDMIKDDLK